MATKPRSASESGPEPGSASEWVTRLEAAAIIGCSPRTIDRLQSTGAIARRYEADRKLPSLNRASVEAYADHWRREQREQAAAMKRRERELERERRHLYGPPDDGDVWLDTTTAALVIGVTPQYLARLARTERIPARRYGQQHTGVRRLWFRRRDVEQYAAARALVALYVA